MAALEPGSRPLEVEALTAEELAAEAQRGSKASFAELAIRFGPRLYSYFRNRIRSRETCEDLVQETLVRAYENIRRYNPRHAFATWLFTIGTRRMLDCFRAERRRRRLPAASRACATLGTLDAMAQDDQGHAFWTLLRALPARQYDVLWLRYVEEMQVKEIARTLTLTRVHVKVLLFRARGRAAALLAPKSAALGLGEVRLEPASQGGWPYRQGERP